MGGVLNSKGATSERDALSTEGELLLRIDLGLSSLPLALEG